MDGPNWVYQSGWANAAAGGPAQLCGEASGGAQVANAPRDLQDVPSLLPDYCCWSGVSCCILVSCPPTLVGSDLCDCMPGLVVSLSLSGINVSAPGGGRGAARHGVILGACPAWWCRCHCPGSIWAHWRREGIGCGIVWVHAWPGGVAVAVWNQSGAPGGEGGGNWTRCSLGCMPGLVVLLSLSGIYLGAQVEAGMCKLEGWLAGLMFVHVPRSLACAGLRSVASAGAGVGGLRAGRAGPGAQTWATLKRGIGGVGGPCVGRTCLGVRRQGCSEV
eukprot:350619-Chlamydomonas_euryale.AAC.1